MERKSRHIGIMDVKHSDNQTSHIFDIPYYDEFLSDVERIENIEIISEEDYNASNKDVMCISIMETSEYTFPLSGWIVKELYFKKNDQLISFVK